MHLFLGNIHSFEVVTVTNCHEMAGIDRYWQAACPRSMELVFTPVYPRLLPVNTCWWCASIFRQYRQKCCIWTRDVYICHDFSGTDRYGQATLLNAASYIPPDPWNWHLPLITPDSCGPEILDTPYKSVCVDMYIDKNLQKNRLDSSTARPLVHYRLQHVVQARQMLSLPSFESGNCL